MTIRLTLPTLACLGLLAAPTAAQCVDPPVPVGGFTVVPQLNQTINYSDLATSSLDVRFPSATPPNCGWPVVLVVHGLGGSKSDIPLAAYAAKIASQGYFTVAHDVRGQGAAYTNPATEGCSLIGPDERIDLIEIVNYVTTNYSGTADTNRLGITGVSQGAAHCWAAAAWSGKTLPPTTVRPGTWTFPTFKAAYPLSLAPVSDLWLVPQGNAVTHEAATLFSTPVTATVRWQTAFYNTVNTLMAAESYGLMAAVFGGDPIRQDLLQLASSTVPVMAQVAWNDNYVPVDRAIDALNVMPSTTPTRAILSTPGHADPGNVYQLEFIYYQAERWFDRFLRNENNGVDLEPRFVSAVVPDTLAAYVSGTALLWNRYLTVWPPAGVTQQRFYLRQGGQLLAAQPTTAEPSDPIVHTVTPGHTMNGYILSGADPLYLLGAFGLPVEQAYTSAPLTVDTEIAGSITVALDVTASGLDYQLGCALYQVPPTGPERYLQSGVALVRGGSTMPLSVDFADIHVLLRAGSSLRLKVQNVSQRFPPGGGTNVQTIPYFTSVNVDIFHQPTRLSWIDIPVRDEVRPALGAPAVDYATTMVPLLDMPFLLESHSGLWNSSYIVLFSLSGIAPGTTLGGSEWAFLNSDPLTNSLLPLVNGTFLPNCAGNLDTNGNANPWPIIALSQLNLSGFVGLRAAALALVFTPAGLRATNPVEWTFR